MRHIAFAAAILALPSLATAGALTGAAPGSGGLRCTDFATTTFNAAFFANGTCSVAGRAGTSGFVRGERLCRVARPEGGDLRVGPRLSFTWDKAGSVTVVDGQCRRG